MPPAHAFPPLETLSRLGLALGLGLFVGLEREWRHKEAGLRTFGFTSMLCCLGGLLGLAYAVVSIELLGILLVFINWHAIRAGHKAELTTSVALALTGFVGIFAGLGHTFTPIAVALVTAGLLAWKEQLADFSIGLSVVELRSAILLAILAFVVYPILPRGAIDPWDLIEPRAAWVTVILIAAIGFGNYVLLKRFGARGVQLTGFFGGLLNSTVTVTELAVRTRESDGQLRELTYRGVLFATCAMALRNAVILGIFAAPALIAAAIPLSLILLVSLGFAWRGFTRPEKSGQAPSIPLRSPFSLQSALKFGALFLCFQVVGTIAQELLGHAGFYAVNVLEGFVSSASAVASVAMLTAQGRVSPEVAGVAAVLVSLASACGNWVLTARVAKDGGLTRRLGLALGVVLVIGVCGAALQSHVPLHVPASYRSMFGATLSHFGR